MQMVATHKELREGWRQVLANLDPDYFVTLTFKVRFPDKVATSAAQFFLRSIFKLLPKPSRKHISGAVVVERTKQNARFTGFYHFHFLFCHVAEHVADAGSKLTSACEKSAARIRDNAGNRAVLPNNVHVMDVNEPIGLARYLTKMGEFPFDRDGLLIWFFDRSGIMHDLPDQPHRIWVPTTVSNPVGRRGRLGAFYSPVPVSIRCTRNQSLN